MADLRAPGNRRSAVRRTPQMTLDSVRLVWRADRRHLATTLGLQVLTGAATATQLLVAREIIQALVDYSRGAPASELYVPFGTFIAVLIGMAVINGLIAHQRALLTEQVSRYVLDKIIRVGSKVPFTLLETPRFYDQLQRAMASGNTRVLGMVTAVTQLGMGLITSVGIAAVLILLEPLLALLVAVATIPVLMASIANSGASYHFQYALTPEGRERGYLMTLMTNRDAAKELRLMGLGDHLRGRYTQLNDDRLRRLRVFVRQRLRVTLLGSFANVAGMAIALGALILMLRSGRLGVADALTAGVAMQVLAGRFSAVIASISQLIESAMFLDDFNTFLALAPEGSLKDSRGPRPRAVAGRCESVRFESVSFTYPGRSEPAVDDVSLEIGRGEVVALVGANGSGKTTLVKLLCQLYEPSRGVITWNGVDARTLGPEAIAEEVTALFQDYVRYHLSARDNITFGRVDRADDAEATTEAALQAGAHGFVADLPNGYDTRLGLQFNGGMELSGGQWQRLALARAFFRDASLLVLDEPTASLDARSEHELFSQMQRLAAGRSVLLISHRFSSVRAADRIYVLENGRIIESGSHDALVALGGHYAELFALQAAAYLDSTAPIDEPVPAEKVLE